MARLHGRRRLSHAGALALRRLGHGRGGRLERAALLARDRRRSGTRSRSAACGRSIRPRRSCMSAISKPTPSRAGPGNSCRPKPNGKSPRARNARRCLRHRVAMDAQRLPALSGLSRRRRRARRIQRQVHGEPDGAARQLAWRRPPTTRASATATSSIRRTAGSSWACGSPTTRDAPQPSPQNRENDHARIVTTGIPGRAGLRHLRRGRGRAASPPRRNG